MAPDLPSAFITVALEQADEFVTERSRSNLKWK